MRAESRRKVKRQRWQKIKKTGYMMKFPSPQSRNNFRAGGNDGKAQLLKMERRKFKKRDITKEERKKPSNLNMLQGV